MDLRKKKGKAIKNQFVLSVGDEGAILCHYHDGSLANRFFVDSPYSPDVKLIEKLTSTYPKSPISILVDVIEQNYSQQVLPPVSSWGVKQQVKRRIKRDFQPNDLNNTLLLERSKEGRRDWNFLFISLANSDPFAKWLEIVLAQKNDFKGVFLLPIEATEFTKDLYSVSLKENQGEWKLLVLHNKVGGFRIVAFKNGKLIFTRLAQNLIGDNIAEIVVGNMEQEISNTVEYLKRLAFKGEADSHLTIIAGADILQKIDPKTLKFGQVDLITPFEASEKLNLPEAVTDKDKFADVLLATYFSSSKKHVLKFTSNVTQKVEALYNSIKGIYAAAALISLIIIGFAASDAYDIKQKLDDKDQADAHLLQSTNMLSAAKAKKDKLPKNIDKMLDIMSLSKMLSEDKLREIKLISDIAPVFNDKFTVTSVEYVSRLPDAASTSNHPKADAQAGDSTKTSSFTFSIDMNFYISAHDQDLMNNISGNFLNQIAALFPNYKVSYASPPLVPTQGQYESIVPSDDGHIFPVSAKILITGEL